MTLNQAIASGKRFALTADATMGDYTTAEEFLEGGISLDYYNATDYEVEPDAPLAVVPLNVLMDAWNGAKGSSRSIALASESEFFKRFTARIKASGITVTGSDIG